jgi:phospholipid N-methyltransferase
MWTPERADLLLELCGEIGDEDTSLCDRAEERAERFEGYSDKRAHDAQAARAAVDRIADGIPMGQPILVGHHSERHARKDAERIENGMRKTIRMWETSKYWERRAAGALHHAKYKELPGVRQRRIKGLEADRRRHERSLKASEFYSKAWSKPDLTDATAKQIANYDRAAPFGVWSSLDKGEINAAQAAEKALARHVVIIADANRWIAHIDLRLAYERAMLGDVPTPPKPSRRDLAPMANFPGEGYATMTKAEYAKLHCDYKGTRLVRGARVRTAIVRGALCAIYLSDSKRVDPPVEGSDAPPRFKDFSAEIERRRDEQATNAAALSSPPRAKREAPAELDAMRAQLKAGVQVVAAPQLFPTPADLATRMVELAKIEPHHLVLEPSAGTGNLVRAIRAKGACVTSVEVDARLAKALADSFMNVRHADFLALNPGDLDTFDRVVMNPPFADGADIKHVRHALTMLREGGILVGLCANGPRQRDALKPIAATWEDLPEGTFKTQGTNVNVALFTIVRSA